MDAIDLLKEHFLHENQADQYDTVRNLGKIVLDNFKDKQRQTDIRSFLSSSC